jgi:hypothetical protein
MHTIKVGEVGHCDVEACGAASNADGKKRCIPRPPSANLVN